MYRMQLQTQHECVDKTWLLCLYKQQQLSLDTRVLLMADLAIIAGILKMPALS